MKRHNGFSLVELMVVISVIVIVGMISVPTLVTTYPTYKLKKTSRDLCSHLRKARSLAIKLNRDITVEFKVNEHAYTIDGGTPIKLEAGVFFGHGSATSPAEPDTSFPDDGVSFENNRVTFNARGLVTPATNRGNVYVYNDKGSCCAGVTTIAGTITMKQWRGASWE
ncbi:MAG: GspH/FimT family protein [Desulfobacterota bacterium]|nr:GspH/FimT family protein [Thermodesulfobacteriota bacterium]